jgi:fructose-1,6-bisphosphatase/inositol monophosphatase family enzyme
MFPNPQLVVDRLRELQRLIRDTILRERNTALTSLASVSRVSAADTIYGIDAAIEPIIEDYCEHWGKHTPLVLVAEGIEPETGKTFPHGTPEADAPLRLIMDPIDGTRGIMYDKRSAWCLAAAAPNKGPHTKLSDTFVSVMTELPTSRMGQGDVLWAIKGHGAHMAREHLHDRTAPAQPLTPSPSRADNIAHGFASVVSYFPGTKLLAAELMEFLVERLIGKADVNKALVFDDQYICTGGQFYELLVGHDRFIADLRPLFYRIQNQPEGLCCHPYDCAALLIATEAGVRITHPLGQPLDAPFDTTTSVPWAAYANPILQQKIEPLLIEFLRSKSL